MSNPLLYHTQEEFDDVLRSAALGEDDHTVLSWHHWLYMNVDAARVIEHHEAVCLWGDWLDRLNVAMEDGRQESVDRFARLSARDV